MMHKFCLRMYLYLAMTTLTACQDLHIGDDGEILFPEKAEDSFLEEDLLPAGHLERRKRNVDDIEESGDGCVDDNGCKDGGYCRKFTSGFYCDCHIGFWRPTETSDCKEGNKYQLNIKLDHPYNQSENATYWITFQKEIKNHFSIPNKSEAVDVKINSVREGSIIVDATVFINSAKVEDPDGYAAKPVLSLKNLPVNGIPAEITELSFQNITVTNMTTACNLRRCDYGCAVDNSGIPICQPDTLPLIIGLSVGIPVFVFLVIVVIALCCCRRSKNSKPENNSESMDAGETMWAAYHAHPTRMSYGSSMNDPASASRRPAGELSAQNEDRLYMNKSYDSTDVPPSMPHPDSRKEPASNLSWDHMYKAVPGEASFRIPRPQIRTLPSSDATLNSD